METPAPNHKKIGDPLSTPDVLCSMLGPARSLDKPSLANLRHAVRALPHSTPFVCVVGCGGDDVRGALLTPFHPPGSVGLEGRELTAVAEQISYSLDYALCHRTGPAEDRRILRCDGESIREITPDEARLIVGGYLASLHSAWLADQPEAVRQRESALAPLTGPVGTAWRSVSPGDVWRNEGRFTGNLLVIARVASRTEAQVVMDALPLEAVELYDPEVVRIPPLATGENPAYMVCLNDVPREIADCLKEGFPLQDGAARAALADAARAEFFKCHGNGISGRLDTPGVVSNALTSMLSRVQPPGTKLYASDCDYDLVLANIEKTPFLCVTGRGGASVHLLRPTQSYAYLDNPRINEVAIIEQVNTLYRVLQRHGAKVFHFQGERIVPVTVEAARQTTENYRLDAAREINEVAQSGRPVVRFSDPFYTPENLGKHPEAFRMRLADELTVRLMSSQPAERRIGLGNMAQWQAVLDPLGTGFVTRPEEFSCDLIADGPFEPEGDTRIYVVGVCDPRNGRWVGADAPVREFDPRQAASPSNPYSLAPDISGAKTPEL